MATEATRAQVFFQLMTGYRVSQALYVAAKLGIADLLADGPRNAEDLARSAGAHPPSLHRLLRALASVGVLAEDEGRFALTGHGSACAPMRPTLSAAPRSSTEITGTGGRGASSSTLCRRGRRATGCTP